MSSTAAVLVPQFDASALRKELGGMPKHVRVIVTVGKGSGKSHPLLLATIRALAEHQAELRDMVRRNVGLALFAGEERGSLPSGSVQNLALLAAETSVAPYLVPDREALRRLVDARASGAEDKLIASATLDGDELVVWSCEPRRYRVAISAIPALAGMPTDAVPRFRVSESGSRIHWDEGDVDLGLDAFRVHADAAYRAKKEREVRGEARRYAAAIRELRKEKGLKQSEISGLSEREVRRLESGRHMPQYASLEKLARAHGITVDDYLRALANHSGAAVSGRSSTLENDRRFLARIKKARGSVRSGRRVELKNT